MRLVIASCNPDKQRLVATALQALGLSKVTLLQHHEATVEAADLPLPDLLQQQVHGSLLLAEEAHPSTARLGFSIGLGHLYIAAIDDTGAPLYIEKVSAPLDIVPPEQIIERLGRVLRRVLMRRAA